MRQRDEPDTGPPGKRRLADQRASAVDAPRPRHLLGVYEHERGFIDLVVRFVAPALEEGEAAIAVLEQDRRRPVEVALLRHGIDVQGAKRAEQLVIVDATCLLAGFAVDDAATVDQSCAPLLGSVARTAANGREMHLISELGSLLWHRGSRSAAVAVEEMNTQLAASWPLTLLCPYPTAVTDHDAGATFRPVRAQHADAFPCVQGR